MADTFTFQHVCDGCGKNVAPEHVRERIARLEWATRFRPLHMNTLLLAAAPPATPGDFFYRVENTPEPGTWGHLFAHALLGVLSTERFEAKTKDARLADFQRAGLYLGFVSECPIERPEDVLPFADVLIRRVRFSYRPKSIVLLDHPSGLLAPILSAAPLPGIRIVQCQPGSPGPESVPDGWEKFQAALRAALKGCATMNVSGQE